jgi:hypothetical protein
MATPQHTQLPLALQSEEWRPVVSYEGLYEVSSLGRVRSAWQRANRLRTDRILRAWADSSGYLQVALYRKGERRRLVHVHRLVALAFLGPIPAGKEVNHKDKQRQNCRVGNLEYVTHSENLLHAYRDGSNHQRGAAHFKAKLTAEQVYAIRHSPERGATLARHYGVSQSIISCIRLRKTWRSLPEKEGGSDANAY